MPIGTNIIRPIPRPKILTRITLSADKTLRVYVSDSSQYDTTVDAVISSGDYYVSGDNQSDDLLFAIKEQLNDEILNTHSLLSNQVALYIDPDSHKVVFSFYGNSYQDSSGHENDVKIAWTEEDGAFLGAILGFDTASDDTSTSTDNPTFTADSQHAYGWYADEDGYLRNDSAYDIPEGQTLISRSPSGKTKAQHIGTVFDNFLELQQIPFQLIWSDGTDYESTPPWPLNTNEPLECWFREAIQGTPFRVYPNGYVSSSRAVDRGTADVSSTDTQLDDSSKSWTADQYNGYALYVPDFYITDTPGYWYIEDTGSTSLTIPNDISSINKAFDSKAYYVLDHTYRTYVLNTNEMKRFSPQEMENVPRYDLRIPLWKFVE